MSRYVDIEPYEEYVLQRHYRNSMGECIETIPLCGLPIADVQEVRHGRWKPVQYGCVCSVCGKRKEQFSDNFCANCGAKMERSGE